MIVGISSDSVESHQRFRASLGLPFHLLSDRDESIIRTYGVGRRIPFIPSKRVTYVVDKAGTIRGVFHHEISMGQHKNDVLDALEAFNASD